MMFVFVLWLASSALEMLLHVAPALWRWRKTLAIAALIFNSFAATAVLVWRFDLWSVLLFALSLYRSVNCLRIVEGRMHERYLRRAARRTTLVLLTGQILVTACWLSWNHWHLSVSVLWLELATLQCAVAATLLAATAHHLRHTSWPAQLKPASDAELPTVSVAIPARNETEDLDLCLQSLIASDYPKLEILVLDDRSQTRRTPEIIRSFAHAGVRFLQGEAPSDTWLPKTSAYNQLAHEASGDIIVFCGADVRFAPATLTQIVAFMHDRGKKMVSILPERQSSGTPPFALVQAMRYWWELALPRRWLNRPPVLSTCWAIDAEAFKQAGGFAAVTRSIVPEAYFAQRLIEHDEYSFMRAGASLGLLSAKAATEQRATAVRMRYPQLHRRPENIFLATFLEYSFLLLPFGAALLGFWTPIVSPLTQALSAVASVMIVTVYASIAVSTRVNAWPLAFLAAPLAILLDLELLNRSMWQYEFGAVDWKGRNISIPAMHVYPHLPDIE